MACAPSNNSDQPGHLIRVFAVCTKKALVLSYPLSAQADLSLCWVHWSFCWFCHAAAETFDFGQWCLYLRMKNSNYFCHTCICCAKLLGAFFKQGKPCSNIPIHMLFEHDFYFKILIMDHNLFTWLYLMGLPRNEHLSLRSTKPTKWAVFRAMTRSARASSQSAQSLRCALNAF